MLVDSVKDTSLIDDVSINITDTLLVFLYIIVYSISDINHLETIVKLFIHHLFITQYLISVTRKL